MKMLLKYSLILIFIYIKQILCENIDITIDANGPSTKFPHFWRSTGLCPPDPKETAWKYLLNDDMKLNLALIGSLPNHGIKHVRIHWLLNLINSEYNNMLNFTHLDNLLNFLYKYNLLVGFELMGYPQGRNITNDMKTEQYWSHLTYKIVARYINQFGLKTVSKWRFETWNEPDLKTYNLLNFTLPEYLQYVRGCGEGLKLATTTTQLKFGGPAGLFRDQTHHPLCWGILEACSKSQCPLSYISFHRKGNATAQTVLNGTMELLDLIYKRYPELNKMPIANDEADILKTWSKPLEWRTDVRYPSMILNVISNYYKSVQLNRKLKIEVLSNDNAFLNYHPFYFQQRTLFARFQMNNTNPPHNQFIKKPVYSVMGLLSLLGDEYLTNTIYINHLTVIPTRSTKYHHNTVTILLAYSNNTEINVEIKTVLNIKLTNLPLHQQNCNNGKYLIYGMDNTKTNPYKLWYEFRQPVFPTKHMRRQLRNVQEPFYVQQPTSVHYTTLNITLTPTIPNIFLINFCCKSNWAPNKVAHVHIFNVTYNEILITWKYGHWKMNRCIQTFIVEQSLKCSNSSSFKRVNLNDTIFLSYHHAATDMENCENTKGTYRIRAMDYWRRYGPYSTPITYP